MNCIIVDDDLFSTKLIADFIKRTSYVDLVNSFSNAIDAVDYLSVSQENIDIIFLDIEMPEMSGIDFMKAVDRHGTQIIIYSSQEKYALESYEYNVCDYLLKPVTYVRFLKAINKAKTESEKLEGQTAALDATGRSANEIVETEIYIRDNTSKMYKVRFNDVIYVAAQENYVELGTTTRTLTIHTTMKSILDKLPESYIVRVHRSYAIGRRYIKDILGNEIRMLLTEKTIPIGKSYKDTVKALIESNNQ